MKAEELKQKILENHLEWLNGMISNIEDYPNSLDIAESANQADFKDTMFSGTDFEWIENTTVVGENGTFNAEFDYFGFSFSIYQNEDVNGDEDWFIELEDEYNFSISWTEFDNQVNEAEGN